MFENLFPQENTSLRSLADLSGKVEDAASLLSEMVGSASAEDYRELFERMLEHESESQDLFFQTMTHVRSTFTSPVPREDLYTLANHLMSATEYLTSAGHVLSLLGIDRFTTQLSTLLDTIQREATLTTAVIPRLDELKSLDQYWIDMLRLSRQARRTFEIYEAEIVGRYKTDRYLKTKQFATRLQAASDSMRNASMQIGRIIVQES